ncbi:hypothetical protein SAMN05443252_105294 [Bacillus sp. OV322]|uniref:hypothetical protein n=1 Tax=Bacillus sp. OV322 TaxID=1882764 RepID=UPI0008E40A5C|nr:hypothetical protein [Bacillus sp. OV322]SFC68889.1 hypothetical protein SAMN05443252_105294 [Bacillus sp. OV322]
MRTKLILTEGLPGSGKTTTAEAIFGLLKKDSKEAELYLEGDLDHPADYESTAFLTFEEYTAFTSAYEAYRDMIARFSEKLENGYLIYYAKVKKESVIHIPDELISDLYQYDIYELPLDLHIELMKDKWKRFTEYALKENRVYLFECCFIQNPLTICMVKHHAPKETIFRYIQELEGIIEPLQPALIYVDQPDIALAFGKAIKERQMSWSENFIDYYTKQGYGKAFGLSGVTGTIQVLQERKKLEEHFLQRLNIKSLTINNSSFDLSSHTAALRDAIQILIS